jgi:phage baseplate assembly protein W
MVSPNRSIHGDIMAAERIDQPHFCYPFQFGSGTDKHALVNQQDSEDDIMACVIAIIKTQRGWRDDLPDFGVPPQVFAEQPLRVEDVRSALNEWEDRAAYKVTTEPDFVAWLTARLKIEVQSRNA